MHYLISAKARKIGLFLIFNILFSFAYGQSIIKGTIKDNSTSETLIGVNVTVKETTQGTITDINGNFSLTVQKLPATLVISYVGYEKREITVSSADKPITVRLSSSEVVLKGVEIVDSRLTEKQKESPLTVESMDVISIRETPAANFYEGLGNLKGVDLTSASIGFKVINTRGFNSTSPVRSLQLIDGVDNQAPGLNFSLGNFLGASELDVMKVELIVGASSAFYGPNAFNGVISMTTKNPFDFPGLSVMGKVGERNLRETGIRYAQVFNNKEGIPKLAYKVNLYYMSAYDWEANNVDPTPQSTVNRSNPGGYDAVNRYGDENLTAGINNATGTSQSYNFPGLGRWHRTGYWEKDLVDYNSRNFKSSAAFHYRIQPETELIAASSFGTGTTVYQGDNRYSLKDILFFQNRLELNKKDKYFIRAYATHEDAGNSYDAVFTAFLLQQAAKSDLDWSRDYRNFWAGAGIPPNTPGHIPGGINKRVRSLPGYPTFTFGQPFDFDQALALINSYSDSLNYWHSLARDYADNHNISGNGSPYLVPGTAEFDSVFHSIISKKSFGEGGTKFHDKSALYHAHGEYKFTPVFADIITGANYRLYTPISEGTIFSDTGDVRITNQEYGVYSGIEKKVFDDAFKLNATIRMDKNQNFNHVFSPAASAVYTYLKNHTFRASFSSAIRNPTLADQYLYYNVGRAILLGNITGYQNLVTIPSLVDFINTQNRDTLVYFDLDPVRPEKVKTFEVGYRGSLFKNFFVDAGYYYSFYTDFLGFRLAADISVDTIVNRVTAFQAYRIASNAEDMVTTQGFAIGLNYFFKNYYSLSGNYSWNVLNKRGSDDPIIPAFNTPEHKFNIGLSGRDIKANINLGKIWNKLPEIRIRNVGYSINYKWIEGFMFEGSPQFTGFVPTYDMVDAQVNYRIPKINTTLKLGASNLLNNARFQVYGGPHIGRLGYFSVLVDVN
jgi:iron complex outermembrane recepter protein